MFQIQIFSYLTFGDKHDTNEFFLDPELFLDLAPLLRLEGEGEREGEAAREEPRLWAEPAACSVKSSSSADSTMVGEVHLQVLSKCQQPDD